MQKLQFRLRNVSISSSVHRWKQATTYPGVSNASVGYSFIDRNLRDSNSTYWQSRFPSPLGIYQSTRNPASCVEYSFILSDTHVRSLECVFLKPSYHLPSNVCPVICAVLLIYHYILCIASSSGKSSLWKGIQIHHQPIPDSRWWDLSFVCLCYSGISWRNTFPQRTTGSCMIWELKDVSVITGFSLRLYRLI